MVVIFGWGAGQAKDLGPVAPAICPNCHNDVFMHHVRSDKQFSLYFVPLASYGSNEYLACPVCQHALKIGPELSTRVLNMRAATASFRQGHVPEAYYRQTVDAFWGMLGVNPNGEQMLRDTNKRAACTGASAKTGRLWRAVTGRAAQGPGRAAHARSADGGGVRSGQAAAAEGLAAS